MAVFLCVGWVTCLPDEYQVNTEGPKPAIGLDEIL